MLHIVTICGCGMGSSVILKMNAEKALKELGIAAKLEVQDIDKPVIQLTSFVNKQEIKDKLQGYCQANGILP